MFTHDTPRTQAARRTGRVQAPVPIRVPPPGIALTPDEVHQLQRAIGNDAVARLLSAARAEEHQPDRDAVHGVLRSPGRALDAGVQAEMEARLGADFADVRIHTDAAAHRAAESVQAAAFTSGSHIAFGRGRYDSVSPAGKRILAHELTHVVQQRSGPVAASDSGGGLLVSNPTDLFERAAEANADRVLRAPLPQQTGAEPAQRPAPMPPGQPIQRALDHNTQTTLGFGSAGTPVTSAWILTNTDVGGTTPFQDPPGYTYIRALGLTNTWIRFHLINHNAGGPGTLNNLVPASKSDNGRYERTIESPLKASVDAAKVPANQAQGDKVFFGVEVTYGTVPAGTALQQQYAPYFPTSLKIYHEVYDGSTGSWTWQQQQGVGFDFNDTQPVDPTQPIQITALTVAELNARVPENRGGWDTHDVNFLQMIGGARRTEFLRYVSDAGTTEEAFSRIPFQLPRPGGRGKSTGLSFASRVDNIEAIARLSLAIDLNTIIL